jgi:hypothetical protein
MQTNRALRATVILMLCWVGLRTSFLLTAPTAYVPSQQNVARVLASSSSKALAHAEPHSFVVDSKREYRLSQHAVAKAGFYAPLAVATPQVLTVRMTVANGTAAIAPPLVASPVSQPFLDLNETAAKVAYAPTRSRQPIDLSASVWAILRPASSMSTLATNGQLGASQVGVRLQQPLLRFGTTNSIALNFRLSTPLDQKGTEAGAGLAVRPIGDVPVEVIIERRIAIERGARNAMAVIVAGGIDDKMIDRGFTLSGYAQGGIVGFSQKDAFIDGALRVERALFDRSSTELRIGAGLWGAAQPKVSRIDLGPVVAIKQKVSSANIRISAEYRWRISGDARPASGPVLSVGADF